MVGYIKVSLRNLISEIGEDKAKIILSDFLCPLNKDIEEFLIKKAIEFEKRSFSATHLIFTSYQNNPVLVGYYTLSTKAFNITKAALSKSCKKRISQYATYNSELKSYILPAPLIAQLGKNYANGYNKLITGDELLKIACDDIVLMQNIVGGKIIYLECEDIDKITDFYKSNGFVEFNKRLLDCDETNINGEYLLQMLKIL